MRRYAAGGWGTQREACSLVTRGKFPVSEINSRWVSYLHAVVGVFFSLFLHFISPLVACIFVRCGVGEGYVGVCVCVCVCARMHFGRQAPFALLRLCLIISWRGTDLANDLLAHAFGQRFLACSLSLLVVFFSWPAVLNIP